MTEYLLLFRNQGGDNQYISTPEDILEDMPRWQAWLGEMAGQGKLISTQPIAYQGIRVNHQGTAPGPHLANGELVVGYVLCRAENEAEVLAWSRACPVLKYPHGSVEVRAVMPFAL